MKSRNTRYYTASEAQARLGLNKATFYQWVRQGLIPRVILPGMKHGVYPKRDVDALALSLSGTPASLFDFSPSSPADQMEEVAIAQKFFEPDMIFPPPVRLVFQQQTHFAFYSLKVRGRAAGYVAMFRLPDELLDELLVGSKIFQEVRPAEVLPLVRLQPFRVYFDAIVVDPGLSPHQRRLYAGMLLYHVAELLFYLSSNDYQITGLYAVPYTLAGEALVRKLGFQPWQAAPTFSRHKAYEYLLNDQGLLRLQKMHTAYRHFSSHASL